MTKHSPKICIIGAGFSGICAAIKIQTELNINSFTVFDANEEIGGVWFSNTYPGCSCDSTGPWYVYSFDTDFDWSHACPKQPEIQTYLKTVARKYDVYSHIRFQTKVESLRWDDDEQKWHASILDLKTDKVYNEDFDIVIGATGRLRNPHYPQEFLQFSGPLLHTAKWDHSISLEGKRVGVIGSQASGVQLISAIASKVQTLKIFQRDAPHIMPRAEWKHSNITRWIFKNFPLTRLFIRFFWFCLAESLFTVTRHGSFLNNKIGTFMTWYRKFYIKDEALLQKVTPSSTLICKRLVVHECYYQAISLPNVEIVTAGIQKISGNVLKTEDGKDFELDVLCLATGFQTTEFFAPMKIFGRDGVDILQLWRRDRPQGYLGTAYSVLPNYFNILGPYSEVGHSTTLFNMECQVQWTIKAIKEMLRRGAKSITLKKETEVEFMKILDENEEGSVWKMGNCGSGPWYFDKVGRNVMLWTGSQVQFWWLSRKFRSQMFNFS